MKEKKKKSGNKSKKEDDGNSVSTSVVRLTADTEYKLKDSDYWSVENECDFGQYSNDRIGIYFNGEEIISNKPIGKIFHFLIRNRYRDDSELTIVALRKLIQFSLFDNFEQMVMSEVFHQVRDAFTKDIELTEEDYKLEEQLTLLLRAHPDTRRIFDTSNMNSQEEQVSLFSDEYEDVGFYNYSNDLIGIYIEEEEIKSIKPIGHILHLLLREQFKDEEKISVGILKKLLMWSISILPDFNNCPISTVDGYTEISDEIVDYLVQMEEKPSPFAKNIDKILNEFPGVNKPVFGSSKQ